MALTMPAAWTPGSARSFARRASLSRDPRLLGRIRFRQERYFRDRDAAGIEAFVLRSTGTISSSREFGDKQQRRASEHL